MIDTELYTAQCRRWPKEGRHILAHCDEKTVVVYQAYGAPIGEFALENGYLGGSAFSYTRMSWIKPNFLWMCYRSGWGVKKGQEYVLGFRIRKTFFDRILSEAIPSSFSPNRFDSKEEWKKAVDASLVRLQWDPDHNPAGEKLERRAIQLGLRGEVLEEFGRNQILEVIDMRPLLSEAQRGMANNIAGGFEGLAVPSESVYVPADPVTSASLGLSNREEDR